MDIPGVFKSTPNTKKTAIIYYDDNLETKKISYGDLIECSLKIFKDLCNLEVQKSTILVLLPTNAYLLPPIILGIAKSSCSFFCSKFNDPKSLQHLLQKHRINYFISQDHPQVILEENNYIKCHELTVFDGNKFILCKYQENVEKQSTENYDIAYWMETSGSTGKPKIVKVPWTCILPNISALSKKLFIKENDVIYSTSPATFDPFVVDLFLAFTNSATIIFTTDRLRIAPSRKFAKVIFSKHNKGSVTFIQMTPTLFLNFGQNILSQIVLSEDSSLRICLLGGESFPKKSLIPCSNIEIKFYNIYGITEISCWSNMTEVHLKDEDEVDIGGFLDESLEIEIRENGTLWIGSKIRKCLLEDEDGEILRRDEVLFRNTGDIVEVKDKKIFFRARSNRIIKRFGVQVDLAKIENETKNIELIQNVQCIFLQDSKRIILFYQSEEENLKLSYKLKTTLKSSELPDEIVKIDQFPLSDHGKISQKKLLELYQEKSKKSISIEDGFIELIESILQLKPSLFASFTSMGGDSIKALQLVSEIEKQYDNEYQELLQMLLSPEINLRDILEYLKNCPIRRELSDTDDLLKSTSTLQLKFRWKVNLEKCIDATPSIYLGDSTSCVSVGSHSHKLVTVMIESGEIIYEDILEDRIEGQVAFCPDGFGFVGCYRGFLYKFTFEKRKILWKFDSLSMIKCRPLIVGDTVIFGNYNKENNVWCINRTTGNLIWCTKIGEKGILADPLLTDKTTILLATLDGTVGIIKIDDGTVLSQRVLKAPIFSSPTIVEFKNENQVKILIAEVNGTVNIFTMDENHILQQGNPFRLSGNIFSGFTILNLNGDCGLVVFGCHNSCIYCLSVNSREPFLSLQWKTRLNSPIFSTPCCLMENFLVCCTTTGQLIVLNAKVGHPVCLVELPGEVFSSPVVQDDLIFVGCRDNHLYCYSI
ncbi:beta-alanine-activating enzyme-like isoform X1 [Phlebotomus papatasi]|uniref:beta-alanine-activating enzyme-like isoform X1 n=1 Tax=Phlebotomus papatasi TaxID=29031 RepID=UPI002483353A|nr:beta-alanine-activating enzyme-like isoform X1 [Phlebotomus papatasi]